LDAALLTSGVFRDENRSDEGHYEGEKDESEDEETGERGSRRGRGKGLGIRKEEGEGGAGD